MLWKAELGPSTVVQEQLFALEVLPVFEEVLHPNFIYTLMSHYSKSEIDTLLTTDNHYQTLGVSSSASQKEIRAAFKARALKYHPDKNSIPQAKQLFSKVAHAYEQLSDAEEKAKYDANLAKHKSAPTYFQSFKKEEPKYNKHQSKKHQSQQRKEYKKHSHSQFKSQTNEKQREQFMSPPKSYSFKKPQPRQNSRYQQHSQRRPYKPMAAQRNKNNCVAMLFVMACFFIFWSIVPSYSNQPKYTFSKSAAFSHKMKTGRYKVNYWIRPEDVNKTKIYEQKIELNYIGVLQRQCERNVKLRQRAAAMQAAALDKEYWKLKLAAVNFKACKKLLKMIKKYPLIHLNKFPNLN